MTTASLRPYQIEGVTRLIELTTKRGAAILADAPGLGKTIQVAEFINRTMPETVLIVCPASLRLNWKAELERWLEVDAVSHCTVSIRSYEEQDAAVFCGHVLSTGYFSIPALHFCTRSGIV